MRKAVSTQVFSGLLASALLVLAVSPSLNAALADNNVCGPLRESKAYQQYRLRPVSDFSKLIFLIDRFSTCEIEIVYDGHYFKAAFAARVARWFLATNYKKDTKAREWIMRWCNVTIPQGTPIYVKMPNGKFRLAREILIEEIDDLDRVIQQDKVSLSSDVQLAPLAQFVVKAPAAERIPANH